MKSMPAAKKILLIEDDALSAKVWSLKLGNAHFSVTIASNGIDALKRLETESFDLILLDLILPQMDGFTFLRKLRSQKIDIPVIINSNLGQPEDIHKAKTLGAAAYLVKCEWSLSAMLDFLKIFLETRKKDQNNRRKKR